MKSSLKILIVGLGSIAKKHISALNNLDTEVRIFAYRSSKESKDFPGVTSIFDWNEIENLNFDFAIISSPTFKHIENIEQLAAVGLPLFIEKPLASQLLPDSLLKKINDLNIQTYVACNLRFLDSIKYVREFLASNPKTKVNEVNAYCGSYLPEWRPNTNYKESYSSKVIEGGGVHLDLIHELDYIYWLFGKPNAVHKILKSKSSIEIEAPDYAHYNLDFNHFMANITLNYFRREPKRELEIVFDEFTFKVDFLANKVFKGDKLIFTGENTIKDTYDIQMTYFIDSLGKENFNDVTEAMEVLKICLKNE